MKCIILLFILCVLQESLVSAIGLFGLHKDSKNDPTNNPDFNLPTAPMIRRAGYPAESFSIMTEDSYILTLHRIPGPKGSQPVLLQHGLLCSSDDWVVTGQSFGYMLADLGYDVWFGNMRGNTYARGHQTMSSANSKFWDFSWHEIGVYDLPAIINFIVKTTNSSLTYVGHSMGTTAFYVMASERPEILTKRKVQEMYSLAPIAFMKHLKSPIRLFAPFANELELLAKFFGAGELLPHNGIIKFLAKYGCDLDTTEEHICENMLFVLGGFDAAQMNDTTIPVILNHSPAGASTRSIIHYAQEINTGKFQQYDFGEKENMKRYNKSEPPEYDLSKLTVPVTLVYGTNDWFANIGDVQKLYDKLPGKKAMLKVDYPKWNHFDFLYGKDAGKLVYERVIESMKKFNNDPTEIK